MYDVIEIYGTVIQTLLAVFAAIISIFEIKRDRHERKESQERKDTEKKLVESVRTFDLDELVGRIKALKISENYPAEIEGILKEYKKNMEGFKVLYCQLLSDEQYFSLSYGFDRYINAFRRFTVTGERYCDRIVESGIVDEFKGFIENNKGKESLSQVGNIAFDMLKNVKSGFSEERMRQELLVQYGDLGNSIYAVYMKAKYLDALFQPVLEIIEDTQDLLTEIKYKYNCNDSKR